MLVDGYMIGYFFYIVELYLLLFDGFLYVYFYDICLVILFVIVVKLVGRIFVYIYILYWLYVGEYFRLYICEKCILF